MTETKFDGREVRLIDLSQKMTRSDEEVVTL
jgi:hypothetical protein